MFKSIHPGLEAAITFVVVMVILACLAEMADAQDVKYCRNAKTGEIIVIEVGYACPFGTYAI